MRIHLKNFRCYTDRTFDFGETGLSLLSGCSGKGKSSILMGIHFALYGTGTKIVKSGSTSCSVELEFNGLKIVRTRRPNRLVVNDVHEDEAAQGIINEKFGSAFDVSGYIPQDASKSFVRMSPLDKLAFLEKFAFNDIDLSKIKDRCKALITKRHEEFLEASAQLEISRKMVSELAIPEKVIFPIKCKLSQRERAIANEKVKFKNCTTLMKKGARAIEEAKKELTDLKVLEAVLEAKLEYISTLEEKVRVVDSELEGLVFVGDDKLGKYIETLDKLVTSRALTISEKKLSEDECRLERMMRDEKDDKQRELDRISAILWKEYAKDELESTIDDCKVCIDDMICVKKLRKELERNNASAEVLEEKISEFRLMSDELDAKKLAHGVSLRELETYECPSCSAKLRMEKGDLVVVKESDEVACGIEDADVLEKEIGSLTKRVREVSSEISDLKFKLSKKEEIQKEISLILSGYEEESDVYSLKEDLSYLTEYRDTQNELVKKQLDIKLSLEGENYSTSLMSFRRDIESQRLNIKLMREKTQPCYTLEVPEDELRKLISEQQNAKSTITKLESQRHGLEEEINKLRRLVIDAKEVHKRAYGGISTVGAIMSDIEKRQNEITSLRRKRDGHEHNLEIIDGYLRYTEEVKVYDQWTSKVNDLEDAEKLARSQYASSTLLRNKILEAESIAMGNVIGSINTHAQVYLDHFFPDNPIVVRLSPYKETKKNVKPQINIEIDYKGMECDLSMLSGGEVSRVILAYTLALGEMFNIPIMLLDECTSSLDQDMTTTVFNSIRENFAGRLVVIVAHQVVTGAFDTIINLEEN